MNLYEKLISGSEKLSVVGLGYVGLPIAVAFSKHLNVVGFDTNNEKIKKYKNGIDVTQEVGNKVLEDSSIIFSSNEEDLRDCKFHIVSVPTPVSIDKTPDLSPVIGASRTIGRNLVPGSIVVYESTVYPGVTEDICIPILETESGLKCGEDFKVGYSPERINPGDKNNTLENIVKVVSGLDEDSLEIIAKIYEKVIRAGVHRAESIKIAEASKVIENSQRDINIAFMNELSIVFNKMGIDTQSVLKAAGTKWNFLNFSPGLVGGHCIGVDPYYFVYKAEELGYHSQIILSGRRINDDMGKFVAENVVKQMINANKQIKGAKVLIMGITFKENCPDSRNTKVIDIIKELEDYGVEIIVIDPVADETEVWNEYNIRLHTYEEIEEIDAIVFAVPHEEFYNIKLHEIKKLFKKSSYSDLMHITGINEVAASVEYSSNNEPDVLIDVKGIFNRTEAESLEFLYWRL
ncbi:nucleotide sugar dehydrogenase [Rossellomorea marisflavi]|uniref:nucleotide sugar dehydrogenase n=1 Tax=Rossellomorea marisflavi TaxID=189381 RepID=UPI0011E60B12|nr:nucleotide sugar dehydrogenase [Rossellomorea marisflavi]TYO74366.1 nucleotide sugar dehydrogenase [Rossellomorea marisflavi]